MFTKLTNLFASTKKPARKPALGSFRPSIETLDAREMPSVASGGLHAVAPTPTQPKASDYFYIDQNTHLLKQGAGTINGGAGTPVNVQTLSAGHDAQGHADVFVKAGDGTFWEDLGGHWKQLRGANVVKSYAAGDGGRCYAIMYDNTLDEFDGFNWIRINNSGFVSQLDAVTDTSGRDSVFALGTDNSLWEYDQINPGGQFLANRLTNGSHAFSVVTSFSAGTDGLGNAEVFANFHSSIGANTLYRNDHASSGGWSFVMNESGRQTFSATDNGCVWIAAPNGGISELDQYNHTVVSEGSFIGAVDISAATSNDVYIVSSGHSISEFYYVPGTGYRMDNFLGQAQF
jgi:hypothetical protein